MSIVTINLDDCKPNLFVERIQAYEALNIKPFVELDKWPGHKRRNHVDPRRLFDWRKWESRLALAEKKFKHFQNQRWDLLHSIAEPWSRSPHVWLKNTRDPRSMFVYVPPSNRVYRQMLVNVVDEASKDPTKKAIIIDDEMCASYSHFDSMSSTWYDRVSFFTCAFRAAVEERLRDFRNKHLSSHKGYCEPTMFIIENESREHLVKITFEGLFEWENVAIVKAK